MANKKIDYAKVVVMGPMRVWKWKHNDPGLPWPITGELWKRDDGSQMFEVSIKVPVVQAAAATAGFMAFLAEVGAERDDGQQAKTRWALLHAVKQHARSEIGSRAEPRRQRGLAWCGRAGRRIDRSARRAANHGR